MLHIQHSKPALCHITTAYKMLQLTTWTMVQTVFTLAKATWTTLIITYDVYADRMLQRFMAKSDFSS